MSENDRCCKRVITNPGPSEDWGPCNRFRFAHVDDRCGHEFEDEVLIPNDALKATIRELNKSTGLNGSGNAEFRWRVMEALAGPVATELEDKLRDHVEEYGEPMYSPTKGCGTHEFIDGTCDDCLAATPEDVAAGQSASADGECTCAERGCDMAGACGGACGCNESGHAGSVTEPVQCCPHAEKYHSAATKGFSVMKLAACSMCELAAVHKFQPADTPATTEPVWKEHIEKVGEHD